MNEYTYSEITEYVRGHTYIFDNTDSSSASNHPLRFTYSTSHPTNDNQKYIASQGAPANSSVCKTRTTRIVPNVASPETNIAHTDSNMQALVCQLRSLCSPRCGATPELNKLFLCYVMTVIYVIYVI